MRRKRKKVKIIKNIRDKSWDKYVGKTYEAKNNQNGSYTVYVEGTKFCATVWTKEEIEEIK